MRRLLSSLIVLVAVIDLLLARRFYGFLTGDEVEVLGEAFRVATGFEYTLWNVRNAAIADFIVAPLIATAKALGVSAPSHLIEVATLPFIAATAVTVWLVHRLALQWTQNRIAAGAAALFFAMHWIPLGYGSTTYPRVISTMCITAAALLAPRGRGGAIAAGALVGVSFADRYSEVIYLIPLLILARRNAAWLCASALASIGITSGLLEWIRWGAPFAALREFAHLTFTRNDFASRVPHQSALWYFEMLPRWCALTLLPILWSTRRMRDAWLFVLVPIVALSFVSHKELRYLHGIVPFLAVLAGAGLAIWWQERRRLAIALFAIAIAWNASRLQFLARESMPAVEAARALSRDPRMQVAVVSQPWACGDRLYLGDDTRVIEVGTPPSSLEETLPYADTAILYDSDLSPRVRSILAANNFKASAFFRAARPRDVVVFRRDQHPGTSYNGSRQTTRQRSFFLRR